MATLEVLVKDENRDKIIAAMMAGVNIACEELGRENFDSDIEAWATIMNAITQAAVEVHKMFPHNPLVGRKISAAMMRSAAEAIENQQDAELKMNIKNNEFKEDLN